MGLELVVLGCDGSHAGPGGAGSGYLVRTGATAIWLDAGPGTLGRLQREISLDEVDAVVVSHEHPDHRADLDGLAVALRYGPISRRVPVFAPSPVRSFLYHDWEVLDWQVVADGDRVKVGDLTLRFSRTDHGPETLATVIDGGGASLGYTADTGPDWAPEALGRDLGLLISEATYLAAMEGSAQHLSARQAGQRASDCRAARLLLTHRWPSVPVVPWLEEASLAFGRAAEAAADAAHYVVPGPGEWRVPPS